MKIQFPPTLKKQLVDDREFVAQLGKVVTSYNMIVSSIFVIHYVSDGKWKCSDNDFLQLYWDHN